MPLTMRLKPGERLIVNGAVLRNSSSKPVELDVLNRVTTLHERDLMLPGRMPTVGQFCRAVATGDPVCHALQRFPVLWTGKSLPRAD